jgi:hypothetical protein
VALSPPLDAETKYRRLLDVLEGPVSDRWAVVQIDAFLAQLGPRTPEAESYLLSLAEPLAERAGELDPVGLHPDRLARLAERLRAAQGAHPILREGEALPRAERSLRRRAGLLYGYVGAVDRAVECLPSSEPSPALTDLTTDAPRPRLREALEQAAGTGIEQELRWLLTRWERQADEGTCVPVVERLPSWARSERGDGPPVGALRRLAVQIYGPAESSDRIRADATVRGAEDRSLTDGPITAARHRLRERVSGLKGRYVEGRVVFDQSESEHEGQSAGLALAALFYDAVLEQERCRVRVQVRPEVLLTGEVGPEGTVRPVSDDGLSVKVQTAFFSPKSCLVVPAAQQEAAEAARDELRRDFPDGHLDIVGVDRLDALFYDRRLTRQERIGWARHAGQRLWDRRGQVIAGTLILGLLVVIGVLLYGPLDKNPVTVEFGGAEMRLKNQAGHVVDRVSVGENTVRQAQPPRRRYRAYALHDLTNDGRNEVCWAQRTYDNPDTPPFVACRAVGADTPLWTMDLTLEVSFPEKPAVQADAFGPVGMIVDDLDADGHPELYLTAKHSPYFPSLLLQLDAVTGEETGRYVHPGHLYAEPVALDLDQNESDESGGVQEILVGGTSNAYEQAVFAVLDPRDLSGHGPVTDEYRVAGMDRATERAYLRFPRTKVGQAQRARLSRVRNIRHRAAGGRIWVEVSDGVRKTQVGKNASFLLVHLDYDLHPRSVGTSNGYDRLADSLAQEGDIDAVPDADDFNAYRERIRYWSGRRWVMTPTLNARWKAGSEADTGRAVFRDSIAR